MCFLKCISITLICHYPPLFYWIKSHHLAVDFFLQLIQSARTMDEAIAAGLKFNDEGMFNKKKKTKKL